MLCFAKFCRFCLSSNSNLIDDKTCDIDNITYSTKIAEIIPQYLHYVSEDLPTFICKKCQGNLDLFYNFIQNSIKTHSILLKYYSKLFSGSNDCDTIYSLKINVNDSALKHKNTTVDSDIAKKPSNLNTEESSTTEKLYNEALYDIANNDKNTQNFNEAVASSSACTLIQNKSADYSNSDFDDIRDDTDDSNFLLPENFNMDEEQISNISNSTSLPEPEQLFLGESNFNTNYEMEQTDVNIEITEYKPFANELKFKESDSNETKKTSDAVVSEDTKLSYNDDTSSETSSPGEEDINSSFDEDDEGANGNNSNPTTTKRKYICNICEKKFVTRKNLNYHKKTHSLEKPFECDICHRKFVMSRYLINHKRIHTDERPHECEICKKRFLTVYQKNRHIERHSDEKPFECEICNNKFKNSLTFLNHKKIVHSGEKPFQCDSCDMKYNEKRKLINHIQLIHKIECKVCNQRFADVPTLIIHKRNHSINEKPYDCDICGKKFTSLSHVKRHKWLHGKDRAYSCDLCQNKYYSPQEVLHHKRRVHNKIVL